MAELHYHTLADATLKSIPANEPENIEILKDWFLRLVKAIDMELFVPPMVKYCDDPDNFGPSGIVFLTTSHCSFHVWEYKGKCFAKFDLYSCKDYDVDVFIEFIKEFDPTSIHYTVIDRSDGKHNIMESNTLEFE